MIKTGQPREPQHLRMGILRQHATLEQPQRQIARRWKFKRPPLPGRMRAIGLMSAAEIVGASCGPGA